MIKSTATATATTTTNGSNSFLTHAQWIHLRQEAQLRRHTLATFGPQGVLDLALVGAILGNNIREIGRYSVTCDGSLVRGRYTIYELVHFGALAVTGRRQRRQNGSSDSSSASSSPTPNSTTTKPATRRIYPTTLSNLFPAMVFKAMRRKSVRPPKFQHDDEDDCYSSMPSTPTMFPMSPTFMASAAKPTLNRDCRSSSHSRTSSTASSISATTTTPTTSATADAMLITSEAVLSHLIQHRLHRVKDLPLPRELCFMGAVSLPLPPVLRAMHIAWTMDFLKTCATTPRRQRQQLQRQEQQRRMEENDSTPSPLRSTPQQQQQPLGGLEFRPDVYAHKMRLARLVRAQQQQQRDQKAATSLSTSPPSANNPTSTTPGSGYSHHRLSASLRRGPSSVSIPEENEDEDEKAPVPPTPTIPLHLNEPAVPIPTPTPAPTSATTTAAKKSIRQDKRLMQQLLALENKVPRIVRQWANVARTYFDNELIQEDREVQTWVDCQRMQVVLGCGYRFGGSPSNATATTPSFASTVAAAANAATALSTNPSSVKGNATTSRPRLAPIATALANANVNANPHAIHLGTRNLHQRVPSLSSSTSPAPSRSCFPEGVRLISPGQQQQQQQVQKQEQQQKPRPQSAIRSRPTSAAMNERLSASQQMLSMHLWLSLLVSPLSPEHMFQDQFSFLDS
ncbi:hypothetical protein BGZ96_009519 [Linnemannia gamsii]|uniref:Uncharacterized protein n=1 Tax=Linnemannia gamsii TaxID=64522 RepID=A0ABQ7KE70_9FUNG|nr:hypothetical protein BGZ96_009519 [Linnemannia gamsii]